MTGRNKMTNSFKGFKLLSQGANGKVYICSDATVRKWFPIEVSGLQEYRMLLAANKVNDLLVKVVDHLYEEDGEWIVMERLMPLQYRAIDVETRAIFFDRLVKEVQELHKAGFAHWDIKRPSHVAKGLALWDNIVLTVDKLRLIDGGNMVAKDDPNFEEAVRDDLAALKEFKGVFLEP